MTISTSWKIGDMRVARLGYGAMQLTGPGVWGDAPDRRAAIALLKAAAAAGINFIDTADAYGPHTNEVLIAEALRPYPHGLVIATKAGFERKGPNQWVINGRPEYIRKAIDGNLMRLKVQQIDLWQLHRIDPKIPVEETLGPVSDAVKAGKIRYVGLSEVSVADIERAERTVRIASVQNHYNLVQRKWDDVLDYTTACGMAFIPWYPLASGPGKMPAILQAVADRHEVSVAQVALAWLLQRAPNVLLIPGTSSELHLADNIAVAHLRLNDEDLAQLNNG